MLLSDFTNFAIIPERLTQALVNFYVLIHLFDPGSSFLSSPAMQFSTAPRGVVSLNTSDRHYMGDSQGGWCV